VLGPRGSRVYLHIGEPKTGTTFVQQAMWDNRAQLAARGVVLPGYSHRDHSRASRDLREAQRPAGDPADRWAGEWDVLTGQALRVRGMAVISDEVLAACNPPQADRGIRSLLPAEVHVVLTVRDIASLLPAEWQETVKCRGTVSWEQWLTGVIGTASAADRRRRSWFWTVHDTLAILDMWSRHIPPDHVHVITVPRQGSADALWERFASVLGIDSSGIDPPAARVNRSLGLVEAEFLRRMNETLSREMPDWFYTRTIKQVLAHNVLSARPPQARPELPPAQQAWAREQSELVVAGLRDSKCHIVGDLRDLLSQPATGRYVAPASLPAQLLLPVAVQTAAALADHQYRESYPAKQQPDRPRGLRHRVSELEWTILNGPRTRRLLRNASHLAPVRRLRVLIWRVLLHPARRHPNPAPAGDVDDRSKAAKILPQAGPAPAGLRHDPLDGGFSP
jgi:hypothetical protein